MPLRDHFRPPISRKHSWEGFHGFWPGEMVRSLVRHLPPGYIAEPRVHLGNLFELDVNTFEDYESPPQSWTDAPGGVATDPTLAPTLTLEAEFVDEYAYEVRVFDHTRNRELVAAVELVSPANKDRPESRTKFIAKCAALIQQRVCVSIVDVVTVKDFNLYVELLELIDRKDASFDPPPAMYAVTIRSRKPLLETWAFPLAIGQPLPTLPLWLTETRSVPLELEQSYEETCRVLRVA